MAKKKNSKKKNPKVNEMKDQMIQEQKNDKAEAAEVIEVTASEETADAVEVTESVDVIEAAEITEVADATAATEVIEAAEKAFNILGGKVENSERFFLPDGSSRTLIYISKIRPTPEKYPRRGQKINKNPI